MKDKIMSFFANVSLYIGLGSLFCLSGCSASLTPSDKYAGQILVNQVGYAPDLPKRAFSRVISDVFYLIDSEGYKVHKGQLGEMRYWELSGDSVALIDFSEFKQTGEFRICLNDSVASYPFVIGDTVLNELGKASIKAFFYNRTSIPIQPEFGGKWSRKAGHPDTLVYIHESAADSKRGPGYKISSPLGWYDAGDYNKYVVNSAISTYTLLKSLNDHQPYYSQLHLHIPESANLLPDLLDEVLFNLRWVMTMQDPNDGGVYHKLTTKKFEGFVMPDQANEPRYVVMKTTAATLDYAALLAQASRIIRPFSESLPGLADSCLTNAMAAWKWAIDHPSVYYRQPADISTGAYDDDRLNDEWFWASVELFLATRLEDFIKTAALHYHPLEVPTWSQVGTLGVLSLLEFPDQMNAFSRETNVKSDFLKLVDSLLVEEEQSPYQISIQKFAWGSNSDVANMGMLKLVAYQLTYCRKYLCSAVNDLDYLLGRNATGYCFVTGFGSHSSINIHHRPSASDKVPDPVPGFLAGGPNLVVLTDCGSETVRSPYPARSYVDLTCSYSTNEIAINWNAPLVYLVNGINAR